MNSVGRNLNIELFGESHGECVGCTLRGFPVGMRIDEAFLKRRMDLRRPSKGLGTGRRETDEVIFERGVEDWIVTGREIMIVIPNVDVDGSAYEEFDDRPRPGHADLPALMKFEDYHVNGGGQFSGRMTAPIVAAGALAQQYLAKKGIRVAAYTKRIHDVSDCDEHTFDEILSSERFATRAVGTYMDDRMREAITAAACEGDSVGGVVGCVIVGLPAGFGGTWFDALDVSLARMMFAIPGSKGVEFGKGFDIASMKGSVSNDQYRFDGKMVVSDTNNMGGICGGMCNGMPVTFSVAFKPTPSIAKEQGTVDLRTMRDAKISIRGRHDPCFVPRAVCVVEAMAAITVMDQFLSEGCGHAPRG